MSRKIILLFCLQFFHVSVAHGEELTLAVAANFIAPMQEIVAEYEASTGHSVNVSYGSSGRLYAQIVNGAPYEIFFSADSEKPALLVEEGHGVAESRFSYAIGTLVLWSADPSLPVDNASALEDGTVNRLAIANPRLAPYGMAAMQVLNALGLANSFRDRLVMGENINQAYQFVSTGNAEAGLISLSQVIEEGEVRKGAGWIVLGELYEDIRQDAVLLDRGKGNPAAIEFLEFMRQDQARTIIGSYGYKTE